MLSRPIGFWFAFDERYNIIGMWYLGCGIERDKWIINMVVKGANNIHYKIITF